MMADPSGQHYGYEMTKAAGVRSGVIYPILKRMLDDGWLEDGWDGSARGKPPRRYYTLTDEGIAALGGIIARARTDARFKAYFAPGAAGARLVTA